MYNFSIISLKRFVISYGPLDYKKTYSRNKNECSPSEQIEPLVDRSKEDEDPPNTPRLKSVAFRAVSPSDFDDLDFDEFEWGH